MLYTANVGCGLFYMSHDFSNILVIKYFSSGSGIFESIFFKCYMQYGL